MTPERAIKIATEKGFCKLGFQTFLWHTAKAKNMVDIPNKTEITKPFFLQFDFPEFSDVRGVTNAKDARLIQACGATR
jgi:hypothetical protein